MILWAARLAAFLFVVAMGAYGLWSIEDARGDAMARQCIAAWETRADIRTAIAEAANVPVEALIAVVPDADPTRVQAYRDEATRRIGEAIGRIADPDCDLDAARERLR